MTDATTSATSGPGSVVPGSAVPGAAVPGSAVTGAAVDAQVAGRVADGRRSTAVIGLTALTAIVVVSFLVRSAQHDVFTQDTTAIIDGVHRVWACASEGTFRACMFHPDTQTTDVNPYPLLQYLPGAVFAGLGLSDAGMRTGLIWVNTLAVLAVVVLAARRAARIGGMPHAVLAVVASVTGMLPAYAGHSFGEPLVVLTTVLVCLACLADPSTRWGARLGSWWVIALLAFLASIGKETMFVPVALFVAGSLLVSRHSAVVTRRRAIGGAIGVALGVATNLAFNVFRFGGIVNVQYLRESRPGPREAAMNMAALLVAPNNGLVWFWLGLVVAAIALVVVVVRPGGLAGRDRLGALAVLAGAGFGIVSIGLWWGPFGWYSWGPRLLLPFIGPVIVIALELWAPGRRSAVAPLRGVVPVAVLGVALAVLMVPNLGDVWNREAWNSMQEATWRESPECQNIPQKDGEPYAPFHACITRSVWRVDHAQMTDTITTMPSDQQLWFWSTTLGAVAALAGWLTLRHRTLPPGGKPPIGR